MGFVRPQRLFSGDPRTGGKRGDLSTHCYYLWSRSAVTFSSNLVLLCAAASGARKARLASPCPKVRRVPRPGLLADWGSVLLRDWDALDRFPSRLGFALKSWLALTVAGATLADRVSVIAARFTALRELAQVDSGGGVALSGERLALRAVVEACVLPSTSGSSALRCGKCSAAPVIVRAAQSAGRLLASTARSGGALIRGNRGNE
eukprot:5246922-Prymnesium_polylepis.3